MKTFIATLMISAVFFSCNPNDQVGNPNQFRPVNPPPTSGGGAATTPGSGSTTDTPIDGGLSILLIAGAAYGAKRIRDNKQKGSV
ncbi:MAG: hypothetical protein M3Y85_01775 [Bacteroidota bacterium]|nr:hypothetical protein [Bacteroidota bacterium]